MVDFARVLSALVVAVALIAAQIMPAWADCHSQGHAPAQAQVISILTSDDYATSLQRSQAAVMVIASVDQSKPTMKDICLGNCGCACGLAGMFVFASVAAIDAPSGTRFDPAFAAYDLPIGKQPDGLRRPPRTIA